MCAAIPALLLAWQAPGQDLTGTVVGFDGKPAHGATLTIEGANTRLGEVITDTAGRFAYTHATPITKITAWIEGVRLEQPITATTTEVTISFVATPHVVFRGRLLAPDDQPIAFADIRIVGADADTSVTATTDHAGGFAVHLEHAARQLRIDPLGWALDVRGPFDPTHETTLCMRTLAHGWFATRGQIRDELGRPIADAKVMGRRHRTLIGNTRSLADGSFALWALQPFTELAVRDRYTEVALLDGEFVRDSKVPISTRDHGYTTVIGRVVDSKDRGVDGATVHAVAGNDPPEEHDPPLAASGRDGWFRVYVPLVRRTLWATAKDGSGGQATWHLGVQPTIVVR